jgi:hypothetical protein
MSIITRLFQEFRLIPHPGVEHPEAIEADYQMKGGMLVLDM